MAVHRFLVLRRERWWIFYASLPSAVYLVKFDAKYRGFPNVKFTEIGSVLPRTLFVPLFEGHVKYVIWIVVKLSIRSENRRMKSEFCGWCNDYRGITNTYVYLWYQTTLRNKKTGHVQSHPGLEACTPGWLWTCEITCSTCTIHVPKWEIQAIPIWSLRMFTKHVMNKIYSTASKLFPTYSRTFPNIRAS